MKNLMEKGYGEISNLYYTHITHHSHCKASPHIQLLDHDKLQKFMLCTFHDKAAPYIQTLDHKIYDNIQIFLSFACPNKVSPTITSTTHCQTILQNNHARNAHDNLYMRHQLFYCKFEDLKLDSFHAFHGEYLQ